VDTWMWCSRCGVRQWFKWLHGDVYECSHCHEEMEVKSVRKM
jgi:hypothetical protein